MSSSWNFPSWAKPSYLVSEPSRAGVGYFNFRSEVKLWFFLMYSFFTSFLFSSINFWTSHFLKKNCYSLQKTTENRVKKVFWKCKNLISLEKLYPKNKTNFGKQNSWLCRFGSRENISRTFYLPIFVWARLEGVPAATGTPKLVKWVVAVSVLEPAITKLVQSNGNWQMFSFSLQILVSHLPVSWGASVGLREHSIYMYMDKKCRMDYLKN